MLPIVRAVPCHLLGVALALHVLTQCNTLSRFQSPTAAERRAANEDVSEAEDVEQEGADEIGNAVHLIAVDQTPFFRWLRSGLRSGAKPSRFLEKGTKVELLKENEEKEFSQVRLPDGKKGWVPSRLVVDKGGELAEGESGDAEEQASGSTGEPSVASEALPALEPSQLPGAEAGLPPINEDIGPPIIPNVGITPPAKMQPATSQEDEVGKKDRESDAAALRDEEKPDS